MSYLDPTSVTKNAERMTQNSDNKKVKTRSIHKSIGLINKIWKYQISKKPKTSNWLVHFYTSLGKHSKPTLSL